MSEEVVSTPFGKFLIHPHDLIGETTRAGTLWDGPGFLTPIYHQYAGMGSTIIDVGANIGAFSVWATNLLWRAARVIAVEPIPDTYRLLLANLDLNKHSGADRVIPLNVAAYDQPTTLVLASDDEQGQPVAHGDFSKIGNIGGIALKPHSGPGISSSVDGWSVQGMPLDTYSHCFGPRVSLIKIDAQGCDLRAMKGLVKTIQRDRPAIVFEHEEKLSMLHGDTWMDYVTFLRSIRYDWRAWPTHQNNFLATPMRTRRSD